MATYILLCPHPPTFIMPSPYPLYRSLTHFHKITLILPSPFYSLSILTPPKASKIPLCFLQNLLTQPYCPCLRHAAGSRGLRPNVPRYHLPQYTLARCLFTDNAGERLCFHARLHQPGARVIWHQPGYASPFVRDARLHYAGLLVLQRLRSFRYSACFLKAAAIAGIPA